MNVPQLEALVALAEVGSITKAAEQLHVSAPAVHKRLKSLEDSLDVQLYEQVGQRLKLTTVGRGLLPHVKGLLSQRDAIHSYVDEWKGLERGVVHIGAGSTFSSYLLPTFLETYRDRFPDIEILIDTGKTPQMLEDLSTGELDLVFAVSSDCLDEERYIVRAKWSFDVVLVADPRQIPDNGHVDDADDLQFILPKQEGGIFRTIVDEHFAQIGHQPDIAMVFDNLETVKAMTRAGLGVAVLPRWTVERDLHTNDLRTIAALGLPIPLEICLVTSDVSHVSEPVKSFLDLAADWSWGS